MFKITHKLSYGSLLFGVNFSEAAVESFIDVNTVFQLGLGTLIRLRSLYGCLFYNTKDI